MKASARTSEFRHVPIARVRDYWNARPCNLRHSPAPVGTREYFDQVEARKYFVEPHIPAFADFERWRGRRVLEIGCGLGTDTINFARAGADVTAVDVSAASLDLVRRRAALFGVADRIRCLEADAETLSSRLPPQSFDLVYAFGVVHHSPDPSRIIQQIRRHYVDAGSTLKLMVYHRRSWKVMGILLGTAKGRFWELDQWIARHSEAQTGCPVTYTYTRASVKDLLGTGFAPVAVHVDHIFPYRVADYVRYRYVKPWYFRYLPRPAFRALERRLGWHLCVTARPVT
ncbi:MAG: class I SAM-dependent methyltransferase [Vicinamibacterales bacterium]